MTARNRPPLHVAVYGDFGMGKTRFASTFPQPGLTQLFDGLGNETAYLRLGEASEKYKDEFGTPCVDVTNKKGELIWRVEYYLDQNPRFPDGIDRYTRRMEYFYSEVEAGEWASVVLDSASSLELTSRMYEKYVKNKNTKDGRQWYGAAADSLEEIICIRFASLPINVCVVLHQDEEKDEVDGRMIRTIKASKRLKKGIPQMYPEVYHAYTGKSDGGERLHMLQTQPDNLYAAKTAQIDAPDPCWNDFESLWANWK